MLFIKTFWRPKRPAIGSCLLGLTILGFGIGISMPGAYGGNITLRTAIDKSLAFAPQLKALQLELKALQSESYQAGRSPNPELDIDVENFLGGGDFNGFDSSEVTLSISQKFELGGKRYARINKGLAKEDVLLAELRATRRAVIMQVSIDFIKALGAQMRVRLHRRQERQFKDLLAPLRKRVAAGGSPKADLTRGQVALERASVALESAEFSRNAAWRQLASNWSGNLSSSGHVRGRLRAPLREAAPLASILRRLRAHPVIRQFEAIYAAREAELDVQESLAVPDLTLGLGVRRMGETDDFALVATGSIPLPIRDRNEGAISAALERIGKADLERDVVWQRLKRQVYSAYGLLHKNCHEARRYNSSIVPKSKSAVSSIRSGYFRGRFKVVDLLDAISNLTESEIRQSEALVACRVAAMKIKTFTELDPFTTNVTR